MRRKLGHTMEAVVGVKIPKQQTPIGKRSKYCYIGSKFSRFISLIKNHMGPENVPATPEEVVTAEAEAPAEESAPVEESVEESA